MSLSSNKRSSKHSPSCPLPKCPDPTPVLAALDQPPDEAAGSEGAAGRELPWAGEDGALFTCYVPTM